VPLRAFETTSHEAYGKQHDREREEEVDGRRGDLERHHRDEPHAQRQERREEQREHAWKLERARVSCNGRPVVSGGLSRPGTAPRGADRAVIRSAVSSALGDEVAAEADGLRARYV
jgi:hypothetical protein